MSEPETPKKRIGRPAKAIGKRQSYAFRMNDPMRALVAAAAEEGGRSLSEEIERRIELSFSSDHNVGLGNIVRDVAYSSEYKHGGLQWPSDKTAAAYVYTRLCIVLAAAMGVPVLKLDESHDLGFTVPGFEPSTEMIANMREAAELAWADERGGDSRPSLASRIAKRLAER